MLSKVMEPFKVIAPLTMMPPPADIAFRLTPEPTPDEVSVIPIKVMPCLEPLVLLSVSVGVRPAPVTLNANAEV